MDKGEGVVTSIVGLARRNGRCGGIGIRKPKPWNGSLLTFLSIALELRDKQSARARRAIEKRSFLEENDRHSVMRAIG